MQALRGASEADGLVRLVEVGDPTPADDEVVVQVEALSVNRGEIMLLRAGREDPPGKDIAGRVVRTAADGSGPPVGTRVVGHPEHSGWAELAPVPADRVAPLPDEVDAVTAAALPLAGTTALGLVRDAGPLYGRRVLLTGASGGVGHYVVELGAAQGARITAVARNLERGARLLDLGAEAVVHDVADAEGPFDVVMESVGGVTFDVAYHRLRADGLMLWFGQASGEPVTIDYFDFTGPWKSTIRRFSHTVAPVPLATDLATLVRLVADGRLHPELGLVADWSEAADALRAVADREVRGNAVLTVGSPGS
jgi:NADPH2:quinone reductase